MGGLVDFENLLLALGLGLLAARAGGSPGRGAGATGRRLWPWIMALALAAGGRAALAPVPAAPFPSGAAEAAAKDTPAKTGEWVAGRATRNFRHLGLRGEVDWNVTQPARRPKSSPVEAGFRAASGALHVGDEVVILPTAGTRLWARSRDLPTAGRPLPRRPVADEILRLRSGADGSIWGVGTQLRRLRRAGVKRVETLDDPATSGLLAALLFGETARLPRGVADLFTRTGTRHMLALSGLHVGLLGVLIALPLARVLCSIAGFLAALLGLRWRPSPALPAAALALAFIPLAGQGAPAARAAMALALASLAPRLGRRPMGLNLVGVALILEIALDPIAPLRAGVQLSYLATAALIAAAPQSARAVLNSLPGGGVVRDTWPSGRRRSPWIRVALQRCLRTMAMALATSLVASIATLPIIWTRFGEFAPIGMLATPVVFPPLVVLVIGGWVWLAMTALPLATVGSHAGSWLADSLAALLADSADRMLTLLSWADRVPWSPLPLPERSVLWLAPAAILILIGLRRAAGSPPGRPAPWLRIGTAALGLALFPDLASTRVNAPSARAATLEVHVLDVGNGTAVIVRAPGEPTWIVDAGSRDRVGVARSGVAPLLRSLDVGRLRFSLSHDDSDHAQALPWILRRWGSDLWVGPRPTLKEARGIDADPLDGVRRIALRPGSQRVTERAAALQILAVHGGDFDRNESSSMLDVRWTAPGTGTRPSYRVILSGDAEGHGLSAMLHASDPSPAALEPGPVDALLLPHHGSATTHLGWLLDHLQPREVWVSGSDPPVQREELERRGLVVRSTAEIGAFSWKADSHERQ
ncbi:MAG: competence protein ComEC [Paracoccaceae bacterium]|jgi:competence protein ComEC